MHVSSLEYSAFFRPGSGWNIVLTRIRIGRRSFFSFVLPKQKAIIANPKIKIQCQIEDFGNPDPNPIPTVD